MAGTKGTAKKVRKSASEAQKQRNTGDREIARLFGEVRAAMPPERRASLQTEKDGRLFAIALLADFEKLDKPGKFAEFSSWSANTEREDESDPGVVMIFRKTAQTDILKRAFDALYQGSEQARNGFFVVLTDFVGSTMSGAVPAVNYYRDEEKAGGLEPWGSVIYKHPRKAADAIAAGKVVYRANP